MIVNFAFIFALLAIAVCQVLSAQFIDDASLQLKVLHAISAFDKSDVPLKRRSLAIYAIDPMVPENSPDIWENNVKMFASVVLSHSRKAKHQAFYVFCVVGGDSHALSKYLPYSAPNTAFIKAPGVHGDLQAHISTIATLGDTIVSKFSSVLFLNQDARGPFEGRKDGKWWSRFVSTFDKNPSIGMVGSMISCEIGPHVQTHAFAMRSEVALEVFSEFNPRRAAGKKNKARHLETSISAETINLGHSISSLYYQRRFNRTVFSGGCVTQEGNSAAHRSNPTSWCDVQPQDALFMRFGGHPLRIRGYYCQGVLDAIAQATEKIAGAEPALQLVQPETIYGGKFHELYKEFNTEQWRDHNVSLLTSASAAVPGLHADKVCLLVRTSSMHGRAAANSTRLALTDLKQLVRSKHFPFLTVPFIIPFSCIFSHFHPFIPYVSVIFIRSAASAEQPQLGSLLLRHRRRSFRPRAQKHPGRVQGHSIKVPAHRHEVQTKGTAFVRTMCPLLRNGQLGKYSLPNSFEVFSLVTPYISVLHVSLPLRSIRCATRATPPRTRPCGRCRPWDSASG